MSENKDSNWVSVSGPASAFVQRIEAGRHQFVGDEPLSLGGKDEGPAPYDFLLAALGSCTSMTLGMYARRKEWPLESVSVRLRHSKVEPPVVEGQPKKSGVVDRIEREITVVGPLTDEQRTSLLAIADKCPVHRTLRGEILIDSRLVEPS